MATTALPTDGIRLRLDLTDNDDYWLQRSSNLTDWQDWKLVNQTANSDAVDDAEPAAARFYRLRQVQKQSSTP